MPEVTRTVSTSGSSAHANSTGYNSSIIAWSRALSALGRFKTISPTPLATEAEIRDMPVTLPTVTVVIAVTANSINIYCHIRWSGSPLPVQYSCHASSGARVIPIAQVMNLAADAGGGAALDQVFIMTAATGVISIALLWIAYRHRTFKSNWLEDWASWLGRIGDRPTWSVIPVFLFITTILTAFLGFIWDVSLHVGRGRDDGPLANPAHYFILVGLFFLFIAGALAMILPRNDDRSIAKPGMAAIRITRTWYSPVGGILLAACGVYALVGFPLDDIWHRIFGQDVTLWGPTHLMLIGGAGFSPDRHHPVAARGLPRGHGEQAEEPDPARRTVEAVRLDCARLDRRAVHDQAGAEHRLRGLLIGLSVFQVEFDFGVEQFRLVFQPMLMIGAGVFGCVVARLWAGPGAAFIAVIFAAFIRTIVAVLVGPILGEPTNTFPLYLGIAIVVELLPSSRSCGRTRSPSARWRACWAPPSAPTASRCGCRRCSRSRGRAACGRRCWRSGSQSASPSG